MNKETVKQYYELQKKTMNWELEYYRKEKELFKLKEKIQTATKSLDDMESMVTAYNNMKTLLKED